MFLTQHDIAQTRDYTLNNLLGLSSACLEAGQRLTELISSHSRDTLYAGSKQLSQFGHGQVDNLTQFPAALWLEHSSRTSKLFGAAYEIIGETHKMLIHSAEAQVRVLDEVTCSSLDRLARNSPWEAAIALNTVRSTLESAEQALHGVSTAAICGVEQAEQEVQQLSAALDMEPGQKPKPAARSRSREN